MNKENLTKFLMDMDKTFPIPLSDKICIYYYAEKLMKNATFCYKEDNYGNIIGLVAGYLNNIDKKIAYITIVAVKKKYTRKGIAGNLIKKFIIKCRDSGINAVHLYTHKTNKGAIILYNKLGFINYIETEIRKWNRNLLSKYIK